LILLLFCLSGIAWSGIWGGKVVQAWSQFPAGKWGVEPNPVSSVPTHGDVLNDGKSKEVPWILELTPMPVSGTTMGENGINPSEPMTLETVDRFAREIGFKGRYQLNLPKGETGVWTLSQDSMSYDMISPTADRTVHMHCFAYGYTGLVERIGKCLVLSGDYLYLCQRLCDVVETPSFGSARVGSSCAENQIAGMVGNGCATFDFGCDFPNSHCRNCCYLDFGYTVVVAYPGIGKMV